MDSVVYLTGSHMNSLMDSLQVISTNLANANTAGFKRTVGKFREVLLSLGPLSMSAAGFGTSSLDWPELSDRSIDFSQGPIHRTSRPLDVAIQGDAFFVVDTPAGTRYTRKGRLYPNAQGELTDGAGNRFVSDSGALRIPEGVAEIAVDRSGHVSADGQAIGRLRLVDIPEPDSLVAEGWATFRNDGSSPTDALDSTVIQGAIEESNVNAVQEMVALIGVMRAYEASARIVRRLDALNGRLIRTAA
ncbi:MAG: flagellar hook-basal body protein [Planctomycetota bacterium]|jgi:flagellar basal body rod protein FlgG